MTSKRPGALRLLGNKNRSIHASISSHHMIISTKKDQPLILDLVDSQISLTFNSFTLKYEMFPGKSEVLTFRAPDAHVANKWVLAINRAKSNLVVKQDFFPDADGYLGEGRFGKVYLARHEASGQLVAMKKLEQINFDNLGPKRTRSLVKDIFSERILLEKLVGFPFVVQLLFSYVDADQPVIATEYISGGSTLDLVKSQKTLSYDTVRFLIGELVAALSHLHEVGIVHRDLKLENLMLEEPGHIKIIDFGLAKELKETKAGGYGYTFTMAGTNYYMAPEMIKQTGTTLTSDWFQIGCIVFEYITGQLAFYEKAAAAVHQKILENDVDLEALNQHLEGSELVHAKSFIKALLTGDASRRLGVLGADQVMSHPFMSGMSLKKINSRDTQVPSQIQKYLASREHKIPNIVRTTWTSKPDHSKKQLLEKCPSAFTGFDFVNTSLEKKLPLVSIN